MTQRERVLSMLKAAGKRGIRSDAFFAAHMPRAAARIQELRDSGLEISSEREGKFCRYKLVGVGAANSSSSSMPGVKRPPSGIGVEPLGVSADPGERQAGGSALPGASPRRQPAQPEPLSLFSSAKAGRERPLNPLADAEAA